MDNSLLFIQVWKNQAQRDYRKNKLFLSRMARSLPPQSLLSEVHESVFSQMDCLTCGNCCSTASPVFTRTDVQRIARHLGQKPGTFETEFLVADEEGDFIPKSIPCPFLNPDKSCLVYEVRPKSCRGYPHTDTREGWERHSLLAKNTLTCPAAYRMVEKMKELAGV